MEKIYSISEAVLCIMCLLMGIIFAVIHVPENKHLNNYRISLKVLATDYLALGSLNLLLFLFFTKREPVGYFNFIRLLACSSQSLLMTFTMLTLLSPQFVTVKKLVTNTFPMVAFTVAFGFCLFVYGNYEMHELSQLGESLVHPVMVIRVLFFVYCILQLGYYSFLFYKTERAFKNNIEDYFSDTYTLKWQRYINLFAGLVAMGIVALLSGVFPFHAYDLFFSVTTNIFYFSFAIIFINYNNLFTIVEPAVIPLPGNSYDEPEYPLMQKTLHSRLSWDELKKIIMAEKLYLKEYITLEEIALNLTISRTTLSNFINTEEKCSFYVWINTLRVEHAKELIQKYPENSFVWIALQSGFTEASNFSRTFRKITGCSPSEWRSNNRF
jgi:AraC-like DNA-binding protein